ncbi:MAG: hypothetical protein LAP38_20155 [Acidobacteriia bacterium]|nr:hypothetical protein [Terriglobia bacterium]
MSDSGNEARNAGAEPRLSSDIVEGGTVAQLEDYPVAEKHKADTARYLAYSLVAILGLSIVLQYSLTIVLVFTGRTDATPILDKTFNVLMPLLSGLVGGAATYYFTRERK